MRIMNNNQKPIATGGVSATGLLGVAFIILKLCHVIDWSWWWVSAPFWGPLVIAFVCMAVVLCVAAFQE